MKIGKLFPSKYLRAADLEDGPAVFQIERLAIEWVGEGSDVEEKPVLYFTGGGPGFVLNRTNGAAIAELHGEETDDWVGRTITLRREMTNFAGRRVPCLRVALDSVGPRKPEPPTTEPHQSRPDTTAF